MTFVDVSFFVYLSLCLVLYQLVPPLKRWIFLIAAGMLFYAFLDARFLAALLVMGSVTYFGCWLLSKSTSLRLLTMWIFVLAVCLWLFLIRWRVTNAIDWFGPPLSLHPGSKSEAMIGLAFPVGISFHALQCIAVLVDTYRRPSTWDSHPGRMILYLCYLPQILAGPTERAHAMYPQFVAPTKPTSSEALQGLEWFVWGLFKKVVIADRFSLILGSYLSNPDLFQNPALTAFVLLSYPVFLYLDFSGYTDMARGMSMWFGIRLSKNFDAPYSSRTTHEFWQRWHMTFHLFLRDYVYVPLRKNLSSVLACAGITFALSGLWHGLGAHFLAWAMVTFIVAEIESRLSKRFPFYRAMPGAKIRAYVFTSLTAGFFWAPDLEKAAAIYKGLASPYVTGTVQTMLGMGWRPVDFVIFVGFSLVYLLFDGKEHGPRSELRRWAVIVALAFAILLLRFPKVAMHSYFQF